MPQILLLRHAQASFGGDDYDVLSAVGHRQAAALHGAVAARGVRPARLVSGTMRRQQDTARPFGPADVDPRWDEYDTGDVLGAHSTSTMRPDRASGGALASDSAAFQEVLEAGMDAWIAAAADSAATEPWPVFRGRVEAAVHDLGRSLGKGETGLAFTSSGVIATCVVIALGLDDAAMPAFNRLSVNGSITKLLYGRRGATLVSYNEHAHVEGELLTFR